MVKIVKHPTRIEAPGNKPKLIDEFFGMVNTQESGISIAHMQSPSGWKEPGQTPEFDEYTLVLKGALQVETESETYTVEAGQAIQTPAGTWIRYSTPTPEGAEYIAVCSPAFSPDTVHRDPEAE
jgi:mannose-6-phosphate isomerase-like protein (cupin superfamily)